MKNIILFVTGVTVIAWASNYLASTLSSGNAAITSVGVSVTALGPLIMATVLRKMARQGWSNAGLRLNFKQNHQWYAFGFLYTPLAIALIIAVSLITNAAQVTPDRAAAMSSMFTTLGIVLVPMLFMSVGEELGWRGYLEPSLWSINQRVVINHVFTGIVWGFWHFPILLFAPSSDANFVQLLMVLIGCVALAIIYGQMRLWSDSVWPCVIFHGVSNAVMIAVASSGLLQFNDGISNIISFNTTSVAITGIWVLTSLAILTLIGGKSTIQIAQTEGYEVG